MSIARRTLKGIFWVYTSFFAGRVLTLITTAILGRLLLPDDFGVIGFALIFLSFIEIARNFGINEALIYTSDDLEETADTVFVINVTLGVLQFLAAFLLAPLLANVFEDPRVITVVQVLSFTFVIDALGQTHDALLQKELEFRRRFMPELLATILKGVVSIVLALSGVGLWSLLIGNIVGSIARTSARWWTLRWRPRLRFHIERARSLWRYSVHIILFQILGIALDQADQLLIGIIMGQTQLGYYSIAMKIPEMVIANFSLILTRVLFPSYVKMKDDIKALSASFLATTRYTSYITIPVGLGLAAVAPELVNVVFGNQWEPTIVLLQVLALMGMVSTLPWSVGDVLKAIGRPDISTKLLVVEAIYTFPLIYLLVSQSGLAVWAAVANLISLTIAMFLRLGIVTRFLDVRASDFVRMFASPFIAGFVMLLGVTAWRQLTVDGIPLFILMSSVVVGAVVYSVFMLLLERHAVMEAVNALWEMVSDRRKKIEPLTVAQNDS